ncbi:hypothetical protein MCEET85_00844 [Candidatus Methylopumilus planktonicus]|uniref:hypothetical protein n=1 Tax=Candidatus Methylopumilus planktonicus TaxID=1581557 RepID=UPI003BEEDEAE
MTKKKTEKKDSYLGDKFLKDLTESISKFSVEAKRNNGSNYFFSGSINLQYAIERYLFNKLCNDNKTFSIFVKSKSSKRSIHIFCFYTYEKIVYQNLITHNKNKLYIWNFSLIGRVANGFRIIFSVLRELSIFRKKQFSKKKIFFFIESVKFLELLNGLHLRNKSDSIFISSNKAVSASLNTKHISNYCINNFPLRLDIACLNTKLLFDFKDVYLVFEKYRLFFESQKKIFLSICAEGNSVENSLVSACAASLNMPSLCIQNGWAYYPHTGFRNLQFTLFLTWGELFSKYLELYNKAQKFSTIGNLTIDFNSNSFRNNQKKRTFVFFLQAPCIFISDQNYKHFISLIILTARTLPEWKLIVREHPSYPLSDIYKAELSIFPNIEFMAPKNFRLNEVMQKASIAVAYYSSALFEAYCFNVIPVAYTSDIVENFPADFFGEKSIIEVADFDSWKNILMKLKNDINFLAKQVKVKKNTVFPGLKSYPLDKANLIINKLKLNLK